MPDVTTNKVVLDIGYAVTLDSVAQPQVKVTDSSSGRTFTARHELSKKLPIAGPYVALPVPISAKIVALRFDRNVKVRLGDGIGTIEVPLKVGPTAASGHGLYVLPGTVVSFEVKDDDPDEDAEIDYAVFA